MYIIYVSSFKKKQIFNIHYKLIRLDRTYSIMTGFTNIIILTHLIWLDSIKLHCVEHIIILGHFSLQYNYSTHFYTLRLNYNRQ